MKKCLLVLLAILLFTTGCNSGQKEEQKDNTVVEEEKDYFEKIGEEKTQEMLNKSLEISNKINETNKWDDNSKLDYYDKEYNDSLDVVKITHLSADKKSHIIYEYDPNKNYNLSQIDLVGTCSGLSEDYTCGNLTAKLSSSYILNKNGLFYSDILDLNDKELKEIDDCLTGSLEKMCKTDKYIVWGHDETLSAGISVIFSD